MVVTVPARETMVLPADHGADEGASGSDLVLTVALGALIAALGFGAGGGLQVGPTTTAEMILQIVGGLLGAFAVLTNTGRRFDGALSLALFAVLTALTACSVIWAVQPDDAWQETSRTLAYLASFGAGIALVRIAPHRWRGLLGAILLASLVMSVYSLATKVFPASLASDETYSRLREPFGYWNAVGMMAALGIPSCLWFAARRRGHAALNALAYPILGVLILTVLLAYSRGALLAAIVSSGFWFIAVPLRLRAIVALAAGTVGALLVSAWVFTQDPLSKDLVALDARTTSGHELGLLLVAMCAGLLAVGLAIGFATSRRPPAAHVRRRAGLAVMVALALLPIAGIGALATSERGLGGSISKGWTDLTDPDATTPSNDPGRLTAIGSVRARYYNEAIQIFKARPWYGVGAGGYGTARTRFRKDALEVRHAHSYVFQTAADLGIAGLAVSLLLFLAWCVAAVRATGLSRRRRDRETANSERVGLLTLMAIVVAFGVHSLVDWTWYVPANCVPALLCAGWLAGRGREPWEPATATLPGMLRARLQEGLGSRTRVGVAVGLVAAMCIFAWATWQPLRSINSGNAAFELAADQKFDAARAKALNAIDENPLSVEPLFALATVEALAGRKEDGRVAFERAVQLQPQNAATWLSLADYELNSLNDPGSALKALGPALYLDPHSATGVTLFLQASRQSTAAAPTTGQQPGQTATP